MHGRGVDLFGIRQHTFLSFEALVFSRLDFRVRDLTLLKHPQIHQLQAIVFSLLQFCDAGLHLFPLAESLVHWTEMGVGVAVEKLQTDSGVERNQRLILCMNTGEMRRKLLEHSDGCRLIVDEHPSLGGDFPAQNQIGFVRVNSVVFENARDQFLRRAVNLENGGNHRAVAAETNDLRGRLLAHQQRKGVNQNGFPSASFAGKKIQPGRELNGQMIDDGVIFQSQFEEHAHDPGK